MKLKATKRVCNSKGELNRVRRDGDIPAVAYSKKSDSFALSISGVDFNAAMRSIEEGHLPTTVFEIELDGSMKKAVVKDIQYHPTTYAVKHLDFLVLEENEPVIVNVPIKCTGVADCSGIKLGGFLRQVRRHIKVRCMPQDIPKNFELDITNLGIKQSLRAKQIAMDSTVTCLFPLNEVVVLIAKR